MIFSMFGFGLKLAAVLEKGSAFCFCADSAELGLGISRRKIRASLKHLNRFNGGSDAMNLQLRLGTTES